MARTPHPARSTARRLSRPKPWALSAGALLVAGLWWGLSGSARAADDHGHGHAAAAHAEPAPKASKSGKVEAEAASAAPAPEAAPAAAGSAPLTTMQGLQAKLSEKIGEVRAAYAAKGEPAHGGRARPARGHGAAKAKPAAVAATPAADPHAAVHWEYAGAGGPKDWGSLKPEYAACSSGKRQSPIDIRDGIGVDLQAIQFDYHPSGFAVLDNGHTVQVNVERGNAITVMGKRYELVQFHFHRPSEERINGRGYEMVAHLVHKDLDGKLAVVAVLIEQGKGHPLVQQVWNNLPLEKNEELRAAEKMDLGALLPASRAYYTYMGSLTTPPCSEGVLWMVMKQPTQLSAEQIAIFAKLYPMNARPIQSTAGRLIKESVGTAATMSAAAP
jgi:carbonic anhydrase